MLLIKSLMQNLGSHKKHKDFPAPACWRIEVALDRLAGIPLLRQAAADQSKYYQRACSSRGLGRMPGSQ